MKISCPKAIISAVVRMSQPGDIHGFIAIVDLMSKSIENTINWKNEDINWNIKRGGERGLRGIAVDKIRKRIFIASANNLIECDYDLQLIEQYHSRYLSNVHEIHLEKDILYLSSTRNNCIVRFDVKNRKFLKTLLFIQVQSIRDIEIVKFDSRDSVFKNANLTRRTKRKPRLHLNNVHVKEDDIFFCGAYMDHLMEWNGGSVFAMSPVSLGCHNARPYRDGALFNDSNNNRIVYRSKDGSQKEWSHPDYNAMRSKVINFKLQDKYAKVGFSRGLACYKDFIVGGTSPASVSLFDFTSNDILAHVNIKMDKCWAIHGIDFLI